MNNIIEQTEKLINYIEELGYRITIHVSGEKAKVLTELIAGHNIHGSLFCVIVKSDECAWNHCVECQRKINEKLKKDGAFFGMCYAGMEEYVFPVIADELLGFVSVSGYGIHRDKALPRMNAISRKYFIDKEKLLHAYDETLTHKEANFTEIDALIPALCNMLSSACEKLNDADIAENSRTAQFSQVLRYIDRNFTEKITLDTLCRQYNCSRSTMSHLFKASTGKSIPEYVRSKRLEKARQLLENTGYNATEISQLVGYGDSDYFINIFSKAYGAPPIKYRQKHKNSGRV